MIDGHGQVWPSLAKDHAGEEDFGNGRIQSSKPINITHEFVLQVRLGFQTAEGVENDVAGQG